MCLKFAQNGWSIEKCCVFFFNCGVGHFFFPIIWYMGLVSIFTYKLTHKNQRNSCSYHIPFLPWDPLGDGWWKKPLPTWSVTTRHHRSWNWNPWRVFNDLFQLDDSNFLYGKTGCFTKIIHWMLVVSGTPGSWWVLCCHPIAKNMRLSNWISSPRM